MIDKREAPVEGEALKMEEVCWIRQVEGEMHLRNLCLLSYGRHPTRESSLVKEHLYYTETRCGSHWIVAQHST